MACAEQRPILYFFQFKALNPNRTAVNFPNKKDSYNLVPEHGRMGLTTPQGLGLVVKLFAKRSSAQTGSALTNNPVAPNTHQINVAVDFSFAAMAVINSSAPIGSLKRNPPYTRTHGIPNKAYDAPLFALFACLYRFLI
jgi:hypothetical protein